VVTRLDHGVAPALARDGVRSCNEQGARVDRHPVMHGDSLAATQESVLIGKSPLVNHLRGALHLVSTLRLAIVS